jgi:hypothetical protein
MRILIVLICIMSTYAGYHCDSATGCEVSCANFPKLVIKKPWIAVPWSTGDCYFHNTVTREDTDKPPPESYFRKYNYYKYDQ